MIRPFRYEVTRYGEYSKAGEFVYDHPFQWGSKRMGPDLAREGVNQPSATWHFNHMYNPGAMINGSIMPPYPSLYDNTIDKASTKSKIHAMRNMGVPYPENYEAIANDDLDAQANKILAEIQANDKTITISSDKEIIALISYLKRLGTDIKLNTKN